MGWVISRASSPRMGGHIGPRVARGVGGVPRRAVVAVDDAPDAVVAAGVVGERSFSVANIASFVFGAGFSANILNNVLFLRTIWGFGGEGRSVLGVGPDRGGGDVGGDIRVMCRSGFRSLLVSWRRSCTHWWYWSSRGSSTTSRHRGADGCPSCSCSASRSAPPSPRCPVASVQRLEQRHFALGGAINNTFRQVGALPWASRSW